MATQAPSEPPEENLADHAYHVIEARIVQVKYPPQHALSEQQLSQDLGISRTPIREALRRLAEDKLVQILPRRGAFVTDVEVKQYLHLLDLRKQVEWFAAARAAKRQTLVQRERMKVLIEELRAGISAPDQAVFVFADKAYKDLIIEASQNPFIGGILTPMHAHSRRFWYYHRDHWADDEAEQAIAGHLGVMEAVVTGSEEAVTEAIQTLFEYLEGFAHRVLHKEHTL